MFRGICTIVYPAQDLTAAADWYAEVLGIEPYYVTPYYIEFRIGDRQTELGLVASDALGHLGGKHCSGTPSGAIAYWHVDDLSAAMDRLTRAGATLHQPPRDFGGEGFVGASVVDPFGNVVAVMHNQHYLRQAEVPA